MGKRLDLGVSADWPLITQIFIIHQIPEIVSPETKKIQKEIKNLKKTGKTLEASSPMEYGNTEAEGFICRFHLATEKQSGEERFLVGNFQRALAAKASSRLYHRTPNHFFRQYISPNVPSRSRTHVAGSGTALASSVPVMTKVPPDSGS